MKHYKIAVLFTAASLVLILDTLNTGHALAMFVVAGIIPGTNEALSADRMFESILLITGFTLSRLTMAGLSALTRAYTTYQLSKGTILSAHS